MNVKELIEKLKDIEDENYEIKIPSYNGGEFLTPNLISVHDKKVYIERDFWN